MLELIMSNLGFGAEWGGGWKNVSTFLNIQGLLI